MLNFHKLNRYSMIKCKCKLLGDKQHVLVHPLLVCLCHSNDYFFYNINGKFLTVLALLTPTHLFFFLCCPPGKTYQYRYSVRSLHGKDNYSHVQNVFALARDFMARSVHIHVFMYILHSNICTFSKVNIEG